MKKVFWRLYGNGPLKLPPVSLRLKYGVGNADNAGVGVNCA